MEKQSLYILWTNDNIVTAEKMVFMYSINALKNNWWDSITIIIWGATISLVTENKNIQRLIKDAKELGVKISACKACAKQLELLDKIESLDIDTKYWGLPLTNIIKNKEKLISV